MEQDLRKKLYNEVKKRGLMKEQDAIEMETNDKGFEVMISKLNTSSIQIHIYHWQVKGTGSYAAHKAFQKYYEGLVFSAFIVIHNIDGKIIKS